MLVASRATLYNFAFSLHFLAHADHKKIGSSVSLLQIMAIAGSALAPLVAGFVIRFSGYQSLMIVGSVLLIISLLPLFFFKVSEPIWSISSSEIIASLVDRKNRGMQLSFAGYAIESSISRVVWPIFLSIIVGTAVRVGYIVTIATVLTVIGLYLVGKLTDQYRGSTLLKVGTGFYFVGWLASVLVDNPLKIFFIETYRSMSERFLIVPWSAVFYRSIVPEKYFAQIVMQDMLFNISRIIILPLIMLVFMYLDQPFIITFVVASLFTLLYPLARERG